MKPKFTKEEKKLIGRRIRDARNAEKLTLEQLAEKCECSSKHIGDVERGTVSASWPLAVKIGKALNTTLRASPWVKNATIPCNQATS